MASIPGNPGWQRDLSVSHDKLGDVGRAQGDLSRALEHYEAALAIAQRLAAADSGNADWQCDLSVSHDKLGDVGRAQGDLSGALEAYRAALTIWEGLTPSDPSNAGWQAAVASSYLNLAWVCESIRPGGLRLRDKRFWAYLVAIWRVVPQLAEGAEEVPVSPFRARNVGSTGRFRVAQLATYLVLAAGNEPQVRRYLLGCRDALRRMDAAGVFLDTDHLLALGELEKLL